MEKFHLSSCLLATFQEKCISINRPMVILSTVCPLNQCSLELDAWWELNLFVGTGVSICWNCVQFCITSVPNTTQPSLKPLFIKTSQLWDFCTTCCLNLKKKITPFSIIHFTQRLKGDCLHNKSYAISQINFYLCRGGRLWSLEDFQGCRFGFKS